MITGINLNETKDYVCKVDKDNPTTWKLGALTSRKLSEITTRTTEIIERMLQIVRFGLRGWVNFKIDDKEAEFKTEADGGLSSDILDIIPLDIIVELGTELLKLNKLSSKEIKN